MDGWCGHGDDAWPFCCAGIGRNGCGINGSDVAHMQQVLEDAEGSDDILTFAEIACMPGASVGEE